MKQLSDDITLVRGNNELNVQLVPIPVAVAEFYMPSMMTVVVTNGSIIDMYWICKFSCKITNKGDASGTYTLTGRDNLSPQWDGPRSFEIPITLMPGETYTWSREDFIDFRRVSAPYAWELWGDWEYDNYSRGEARP